LLCPVCFLLVENVQLGKYRRMPQKRRPVKQNKRQMARSPSNENRRTLAISPLVERVAPTVYGKAFIVAEDESKNTFIYKAGAWVPHTESIAECKRTCLVKELPQRLGKMIRYEVRSPE
jgi:hypothetical protein